MPPPGDLLLSTERSTAESTAALTKDTVAMTVLLAIVGRTAPEQDV
jgi:hypothetical protein